MMLDKQHRETYPGTLVMLITAILCLHGLSPAIAEHQTFHLHLNSTHNKQRMCKKISVKQDIRILVSHHRDLMLKKVPNQYIPKDSEEARKKSYIHTVSLQDLTNGRVNVGTIAFDRNHAVIFTTDSPDGISREQFMANLPKWQQRSANQGLNTFLHLHPIFNAGINGCRPYPSKVLYGTDDEFEKIERERIRYRDLVHKHNSTPTTKKNLLIYEKGKSLGFVDPTYGGKFISYQAMNPLSFFRATIPN